MKFLAQAVGHDAHTIGLSERQLFSFISNSPKIPEIKKIESKARQVQKINRVIGAI
jgi:hypothetical protein